MLRALYEDQFNLNDYEIKDKIGIGAYTYTFKGIVKETQEKVAIIVYPNFFITTKEMLQNFFTRFYIKMPGIVNTSNFFLPKKKDIRKSSLTGRNSLILISELMPKGSIEPILVRYLKSHGKDNDRMNPTIRSKIIFGVAATMKQIHQHHLLYEVLNMKNVFLDENLEPKLGDFIHGPFKRLIPLEDTIYHALPIYKAPEILIFEDDGYGFASDVYSFAIFLYLMFSLSVKFPDKSFAKNFEQRIECGERYKRPLGVPDCYWDLIQACWSNDQSKRPSFESITEMLKDDKFAIEEFGMKTNIDELHEYQRRIDVDFPI